MSTSLHIHLRHDVPLRKLLEATSETLRGLLRLENAPSLAIQCPPAAQRENLENEIVGKTFAGVYITLEGHDESLVDVGVFTLEETYVSCSNSRTAISNVLAAGLAIALGQLVEGTISDDAHHWIDRDDVTAVELLAALQVDQPQSDFDAAVDCSWKKQAIHERSK